MKILFAGTPDIAVPSLRALAGKHTVVGVVTSPDKTSGRGRKITPSPVKAAALELGLTVLQPPRLGAEARDEVSKLDAELLVVFAYGRIFGPKFLALFPQGGINMHPSALPEFRGPSPLSAVIFSGKTETALSVQRLALEMDAGDILIRRPYPLDGTETTGSLTAAVARDAAAELVAAADGLEAGTLTGVPQDHNQATYCRLVRKDDGQVDWNRSAAEIERQIRACLHWPKARTLFGTDELVLLESRLFNGDETAELAAAARPGTVAGVDPAQGILIRTGDGLLAVRRLQLASRKPLDFPAFLNGVKLMAGTILGDPS